MRLKQTMVLLLVVCTFLTGCSCPSHSPEQHAVTVAKREVLEKWGWNKVELNGARFEDGRWVIQLSRLPKTPGGHATIEVSEGGKVISSRGGR
jgi:hypothetical protein